MYWRFDECGFNIGDRLVLTYEKYVLAKTLEESVRQNNEELEDDSESIQDFTSKVLFCVLLLGTLASLFVLFLLNFLENVFYSLNSEIKMLIL